MWLQIHLLVTCPKIVSSIQCMVLSFLLSKRYILFVFTLSYVFCWWSVQCHSKLYLSNYHCGSDLLDIFGKNFWRCATTPKNIVNSVTSFGGVIEVMYIDRYLLRIHDVCPIYFIFVYLSYIVSLFSYLFYPTTFQ